MLIVILIIQFIIVLSNTIDYSNTNNIHFSCMNARLIVDSSTSYCNFISWNSANIYISENFTYYNPSNPLTNQQQQQYAKYLYNDLSKNRKSNTGISEACSDTLQQLACVNAFPNCLLTGIAISSVSYLPTCKLQCQQVNKRCSSYFVINCDDYVDSNCSLYVPSGYFILDFNQGPYYFLKYIYIFILLFWLSASLIWNYLTLILYKNQCLPICRAVVVIPFVKVIVSILGLTFWSTCDAWAMCSFWIGVTTVNIQLVYETGQMFIFLLLAKGWTLTRGHLSTLEWKFIISLLVTFYISNSILIVLQTGLISQISYVASISVIYGIIYIYIVICTFDNVISLYKQTNHLTNNMPINIITPLISKYQMYIYFLLLVFLSITIEVICNALIVTDNRINIVIVLYELTNIFILGLIGYIFKPKEHSPYFFMIPARMNDNRQRPIPVIEVNEDDNEDTELLNSVELIPLSNLNNTMNIPKKLIVVKQLNDNISVGVSSQA